VDSRLRSFAIPGPPRGPFPLLPRQLLWVGDPRETARLSAERRYPPPQCCGGPTMTRSAPSRWRSRLTTTRWAAQTREREGPSATTLTRSALSSRTSPTVTSVPTLDPRSPGAHHSTSAVEGRHRSPSGATASSSAAAASAASSRGAAMATALTPGAMWIGSPAVEQPARTTASITTARRAVLNPISWRHIRQGYYAARGTERREGTARNPLPVLLRNNGGGRL
jgi:hypothetical protein